MDKERLYQALRNADAAGDTQAATRLAQYIREIDAQPVQAPEPAKPEPTLMQSIGQGINDLVGGGLRGAGSIGATMMTPVDIIAQTQARPLLRAIPGMGALLSADDMLGRGTLVGRNDRRTAMDEANRQLGANPDSWLYGGGKLAAEIAGTSGVGGILAGGAKAVPALARFAPALQSGGFTLGDAATKNALANAAIRTAAGGATGAATAAMIDPSQALEGAAYGAATPMAVKGAQLLGKGLRSAGSNFLGASTGTSAETIRAAYEAGKRGSGEFLQNMRGQSDFNDVVDTAKQGLANMRQARAAQYRSGMVDISKDKSVLDFAPIDNAMAKVKELGSYKGVQINKKAASAVSELDDIVSQWKSLDPAEYHTPEGLDALKKSIGDVRDSLEFGSPARKAADTIYNSVKNEIASQAPTYNKVMGDYARASEQLTEIERGLSLREGTSRDTAIRKLQSLMRNNAQTNYGNRTSLANQLEQQGGVNISDAIAGQALNTVMPRGMTGAITKGGGLLTLGAGNFAPLAVLPFTSPRLVGEAAYRAGAGSNALNTAARNTINLLNYGGASPRVGYGLLSAIPGVISANQATPQ